MSGPDRTRRLVLVGGGHAHALALEAFGRQPEPALSVLLVSRDPTTPYSGMLPGHVAGFYSREEMHIDLARLCSRAGAELLVAEAVGFDRMGKRVLLSGGESVPYDLLSIDIGITPDLSGILGAEQALAVKPIGGFLEKWAEITERAFTQSGPRRFAVVGGGVAGICLAFSIRAALRDGARRIGLDPEGFSVVLVSAELPPELNAASRKRVVRALAARGIEVVRGEKVVAVSPQGLTLESGASVPADAVLLSTGAAPPPALRDSGFSLDEGGFLAIRPTLQVVGEENVFAVGDCATMVDHPRPKAGVYAVRQGPVLARNLRRRVRGEPLEAHFPQSNHLILIGTGDGQAIGARGHWLSFEGRAAWRLKDWIDRRFMRRFAV